MAALPTRLKLHIRDHITSETSALSLKTKTLATLLGYPLLMDPEWGMLWSLLQPYYPDQATFIPSNAGIIMHWCDAFMAWLEDDTNEEAVGRLLDAVKGNGGRGVNLVLEVNFSSSLNKLLGF